MVLAAAWYRSRPPHLRQWTMQGSGSCSWSTVWRPSAVSGGHVHFVNMASKYHSCTDVQGTPEVITFIQMCGSSFRQQIRLCKYDIFCITFLKRWHLWKIAINEMFPLFHSTCNPASCHTTHDLEPKAVIYMFHSSGTNTSLLHTLPVLSPTVSVPYNVVAPPDPAVPTVKAVLGRCSHQVCRHGSRIKRLTFTYIIHILHNIFVCVSVSVCEESLLIWAFTWTYTVRSLLVYPKKIVIQYLLYGTR